MHRIQFFYFEMKKCFTKLDQTLVVLYRGGYRHRVLQNWRATTKCSGKGGPLKSICVPICSILVFFL